MEKFEKGFDFDRHHCAPGPIQQTKKTKTELTIGLVFHGTRSENIENILQNGLDVKLRKGQAFGPGKQTQPLSLFHGNSSFICLTVFFKILVFFGLFILQANIFRKNREYRLATVVGG